MTKEELLKRAKEVIAYHDIKGWGNWLKSDYHASGCEMLRIEDLENNENMVNFLVDLINIMEKYDISYSGVNGMWCNFKTYINDDNAIRVGVSNLYYFFLTQEEMDKHIEEAKEYAYKKMLDKRIKFTLPDNLKVERPNPDPVPVNCVEDEDTGEDENEVEPNEFNAEFIGNIETYVDLNHLETFTDENDIKKEICEKLANTIYQSSYYHFNVKAYYHFNVKDKDSLINKIQLKEIEIDSPSDDQKNATTYIVVIEGVLFEYNENLYTDSYDVTLYSLNESINRICERININNDINITNIEITEPKWLLDEPNNDDFFESDAEVDDRGDEDDEDEELCCYDAVGSFTADIELNIGKVESNDVNEDLTDICYEKVYDIIESEGVSIDSDEDELFERIKIKELEDGTTLVTIKDVECSVQVFIEAHNLDEANDKRWNAFSDIVDPLNYLKNLRDDYVSEAD